MAPSCLNVLKTHNYGSKCRVQTHAYTVGEDIVSWSVCSVHQAGIEFGNKECILIQLSSSARLHWPSVTSLCGHLGIMQAGSRKAHGKATFDAMCLVGQVLQQAENSGGYDLAASPNPEEQDLQISEDVPSVVVTRSCVWAGNVGIVSVTPILLCGCSQGCREQTQRGASCLLLRNARSSSCVFVRRSSSF